MRNHVRFAAVAAALTLFAAASAGAQDAQKPGGLNKVAHDVSATAKKAGRDTKATLKKTTGIHGSHASKPGGLNKVAHDISNASKKTGSEAKGAVKDAKSDAHGALTETGKSIKDTTLKTKP